MKGKTIAIIGVAIAAVSTTVLIFIKRNKNSN